jgi:hypothetical protein
MVGYEKLKEIMIHDFPPYISSLSLDFISFQFVRVSSNHAALLI